MPVAAPRILGLLGVFSNLCIPPCQDCARHALSHAVVHEYIPLASSRNGILAHEAIAQFARSKKKVAISSHAQHRCEDESGHAKVSVDLNALGEGRRSSEGQSGNAEQKKKLATAPPVLSFLSTAVSEFCRCLFQSLSWISWVRMALVFLL